MWCCKSGFRHPAANRWTRLPHHRISISKNVHNLKWISILCAPFRTHPVPLTCPSRSIGWTTWFSRTDAVVTNLLRLYLKILLATFYWSSRIFVFSLSYCLDFPTFSICSSAPASSSYSSASTFPYSSPASSAAVLYILHHSMCRSVNIVVEMTAIESKPNAPYERWTSTE